MRSGIAPHFVILLVAGMLLPSIASARLSVRQAYYRDTNASLHLLLENRDGEPLVMPPPIVNGLDTGSTGLGETRDCDILWYRCRPNPIPPGGMADLVIVLPQPTDKPVTVELRPASGDPITRTIRCVPEKMRFQAVRFSSDLKTVDIYIRSSGGIRKLRLDGSDVRKHASPWPVKSTDGPSFVRLTLPTPLEKCSFHLLEAEGTGDSTYYQVRAIPAEFLIGVYGSLTPENIADWAKHGCNHYLSFGWVGPSDIGLMGEHGIGVGVKCMPEPLADRTTGRVRLFDEAVALDRIHQASAQPALLYHHLVDEPDVADYYAGHWLGSTAMELAARAEFSERIDPERYTFVQLDNTFRPNNYRVYGEAAGVLATHRYSLGSFLKSEAGQETVTRPQFLDDLLETTERLRLATEPRPLFMVTQFFNLGPGRKGRAPTIGEMRLQCYATIAGGARGLIHYIHSGSGGGGEGARSKPLWDAMTGLHEELRRVGDILAVGTPAPDQWASASTPNVLAKAVLCGDRMAVILINRAHRSSLDGFFVRPMRDITVKVRIPPWIHSEGMQAVQADGTAPIPCKHQGEYLSFQVDEVTDARCLILDTPRER